jgi:hypothetical protein
MVDSLCQNYGWSFEETMHMTLPQIILLNHAASINSKRVDIRVKANAKKKEREAERETNDPIVHGNKRLSQLDSNDMIDYYADIR